MSSRPNVLLVDDRPENLLALTAQLRGLEAEFLPAGSGNEALEILLSHDVAIAIVDVQMPEMDGFELAELMRGSPRTREIPILFVTAGLHDRSRVFRGYDAGAVDFLIKPIESHVLVSKIAVLLQLDRQKRMLVERLRELEAAHAALRESSEQSRRQLEEIQSIYDSAHVGLCVLDRELRFVRVNRRLADINGLPAADHIGRTIEDVLPSLAPTARTIADRVFRTGVGVTGVEFTGVTASRPNVERCWVEQWLPLKGPTGQVSAINVVAEEVTERRQIERALRKSEERYRKLFENMAEGVFLAEIIYDEGAKAIDYRYLEVNAAFESQTGLRRDAVIGHTARELFPTVEEIWITTFAKVAATGRPERIEAFAAPLGRTYSTTAYSPSPGQFACLFQDISDRKVAEEALRASEERFRTVVENSRDGINMLDLKTGRYVFMSPAQVELTGFTADEMRELSVEEAYARLHPDDRDISVNQQKEIAAGRDLPGPVEYRWKVKSGEYRWFSDSRKLVRDAQGTPVALVGVSRDITDRKAAEAELRRGKQLSDALNRTAEVVHASLESEDVVRRLVSEGAHALESDSAAFSERVAGGWKIVCVHGMPESLVGTVVTDDEERHAVLAIQTQQPVLVGDGLADARVNREHLGKHNVRSVLMVPLLHSGQPVGVMFFNYHKAMHSFEPAEVDFARQLATTASIALQNARLYTEHKKAEQALRASEARLNLLSRTAAKLLRAEDPQNVIDELCAEVMAHLNCQVFFSFLRDPTSHSLRLNAHAGVSEQQACRIQSLDQGRTISEEVARHGQRFIAEDILCSEDPRAEIVRSCGIQAYCCHPLVGQAGQVFGTVGFGTRAKVRFEGDEIELMRVVADQVATAMQKLEARRALSFTNAQLVEADRRKNDFLATLSHELRNPLAPIRNSLHILDHATPGGDQARRAKATIDRQVNQLARLVDDLLDVTRITRNKIQLHPLRLELNELVARTVEDHRAEFEKCGVRLQVEPACTSVWVCGDWNRLAQTVGNLLQNAAKFTPREGRVVASVSTDDANGQAIIRIVDTGVGLSPEMLARLFEPFMQAEMTLDRSRGGLGLGLALVKGLVELHGGSVEARSAGLGRGTEFTVHLPLDTASRDEEQKAAVRRAPERQRVLVIEDNADAADSLREVLEFEGHDVAVAYDGPTGLAHVRERRPTVVLCDIGLPGMDGYEVARAIRVEPALKGVKLVALSGYALPEDLQRAREAGFDQHMAKPPSLDQLQELLASLSDVNPTAERLLAGPRHAGVEIASELHAFRENVR